MALPGNVVYAGALQLDNVQDYGIEMTALTGENTESDTVGVEVFDAVQAQEGVEPDAAEEVTDETVSGDESTFFSASEDEGDVFTDGSPEAEFSADEESVIAAGESVPIDEAHFPDENFRSYLLELEETNGDGDGTLDPEEISGITQISSYDMDGDGRGVDDYSGIEYLTALEYLTAYSTDSPVAFSLDVSKNTKLIGLTVYVYTRYNEELVKDELLGNQSIILGGELKSLEYLQINGAIMSKLDTSVFPNLKGVSIRDCSIEEIYVSGCTTLSQCSFMYLHNLKSIEFGTLPALENLDISQTYYPFDIKLPMAVNLESLTLQARIDKISLPSYPKLKTLDLRGNRLKELDLRPCPNLEVVDVSYNELTSLDATGLTKLYSAKCLLNNLTEIKGEADKFTGYPSGQRSANINLYSDILLTSQIWGNEKLWITMITNYRGFTPEGRDSGHGIDAGTCRYFTVNPFEGNSTDLSFDLYEVALDLVVPVTLHLTRVPNTKINTPKLTYAVKTNEGNQVYWDYVIGADGYYVYRKINDSSYKKIVTVKGGTNNSYIDKTNTWAKYSYKIKAYGKVNGKTEASAYSKVSSCVSQYQWKPKLTAKGGTKSVALTWKKLNGATGYQIYCSTSKNGKYTKVATIKKGATVKYTDSKL